MNPLRRALLAALALPFSLVHARETNARLGINLAGIAWYNTELPFVDQFRMAGDWSLKLVHPPAGARPALKPKLDAEGWVTEVPEGAWAEAPLAGVSRLAAGEWTVLYEGAGRIELWGLIEDVRYASGRASFRVPAQKESLLWLRIWRTDPANPVRRIRVLMPGHAASYAREPWNPSLLRRWSGVAALRFMDFMATNNSSLARWQDRPRPEHASFSGRGVPLEWLAELANRLGAAPWFCMPHLAEDDYVREFAALARRRLDPALKVYVEYSNEAWNTLFAQHRHAAQRGRALGLAADDFQAALRYSAMRSAQIFRLWEEAFGGKQRLVRVLGSQAVNPASAQTLLDAAGGGADALAIAPYLALAPSPRGRPTDEEVARWPLERLFAELDLELAKVERAVRANAALAARRGLALVAYEGGQHLAGILGGENNDALTALFAAANRDARMGDLYRRLYQTWECAGGDLFCHFSSVNPSNKWGSWGLIERDGDPAEAAPKYQASVRWARSRGQKFN